MPELTSESAENLYKFKELRVYSSTEWLADNKKRYRQVFDQHSTSFVYAELSFYNKQFDREDWEIDLVLKCFTIKKNKTEVCSLPIKKNVSRYDSIVYIREGWGNKKDGAFWKRGTYYWEAWVGGEKIASKYFYVEDAGREIKKFDNPYLNVQSIRLYEGAYDDVIEEERIYNKKFSAEETRYIYLELIFKNLNMTHSWQSEFFAKFYNDARELKGQITRLQRIDKKNEVVMLTAGWGSNAKASWRPDHYTAELVFMDHVLAVVPFEVGEDFEEGVPAVWLPNQDTPLLFESVEDLHQTFEDVLVGLEDLIGLHEIKQKVKDHANYIQFLQLRKDKGFEEDVKVNVHSVFTGNPGTGKTTVAKMMGKLYHKMGLLSKGHVHEVDRVDLVGEYIGQTAPKVKEAIEKARGGVLFIDEAYSLVRAKEDNKDFGREVIEILVKELSNGKGDLSVIVAGYPAEMEKFMISNPGLKSRFKHTFEFSDYMPQELSAISVYACAKMGVKLTSAARRKIDEIIVKAFRDRDNTFGNARFVHDLIEKAKVNLGLRVMALEIPEDASNKVLETINLEDVLKIDLKKERLLPNIPIDEDLLEESLTELDNLIGLTSVKKQIKELVRLVRFYKETKKEVLKNFSFHTVFVGNPGTGKTTVARILAKIYKSLGVLERGHMVETDRQGLVAGFVGQTAIKTAAKIDEALGGVLFIDEAYALTNRIGIAQGDFGDEAIQALLKRMEDLRGEFFVFAAGYPDNMENFLKANPGLNSRFDKILKFEDYASDELLQIAEFILEEREFRLKADAKTYLLEHFKQLVQYRDKYFGNARAVRALVDEIIKNQNLRSSRLSEEERKQSGNNAITAEDIRAISLDPKEDVFTKKRIGFGSRSSE